MTTREKILEASFDLLIDKGFHSTSTKLILDTSKVSNGALYHHFPNKEKIVREIYIKLKIEIRDNLLEKLEGIDSTRVFIWNYWKSTVLWALENPRKRMFMEMYSKSTIIRDYKDDEALKRFQFIIDKVETGMNNEEIIKQNILYFFFNFVGSTNGIVDYLEICPDEYSEEFLKKAFKQYWRSIVNFD